MCLKKRCVQMKQNVLLNKEKKKNQEIKVDPNLQLNRPPYHTHTQKATKRHTLMMIFFSFKGQEENLA